LRLKSSPNPAPHLPVLTPGTWRCTTYVRRVSSLTIFHRLWKLFDNVDADASDDIDASELREPSLIWVPAIMLILFPEEALINGDWSRAYL
jgi:hypothetical protein